MLQQVHEEGHLLRGHLGEVHEENKEEAEGSEGEEAAEQVSGSVAEEHSLPVGEQPADSELLPAIILAAEVNVRNGFIEGFSMQGSVNYAAAQTLRHPPMLQNSASYRMHSPMFGRRY